MALDMPEGTSLQPGEHLIVRTDLPGRVVWLTNERLLWAHQSGGHSSVSTLAVQEIARLDWRQVTSAKRIVGGLLLVVVASAAFGFSDVLGVIFLAIAAFVLRTASQREFQAVQASGRIEFSIRVATVRSVRALDQLRRALSDLLANRSDDSTPAT